MVKMQRYLEASIITVTVNCIYTQEEATASKYFGYVDFRYYSYNISLNTRCLSRLVISNECEQFTM